TIVQTLIHQRFGVRLSLASVGTLLARLDLTVQKPLQRAYQRDPQAIERWQRETWPALARQAKRERAEIYFWDESGFRADQVQGRTWGRKGHTPVVAVPGQRQSISAASAVNAQGAFWFATYPGGLNGEWFVRLLKQLMHRRTKPLHLVLDGLPAHKGKVVKAYVKSTRGKLTLHFLPGYAPELNPDELVWSHTKRTGPARRPLRAGEQPEPPIRAQLSALGRNPERVRAFFRHPNVSYIPGRIAKDGLGSDDQHPILCFTLRCSWRRTCPYRCGRSRVQSGDVFPESAGVAHRSCGSATRVGRLSGGSETALSR
ncbi:ISXoo2 transposase, partial [mine drainage metagenome]